MTDTIQPVCSPLQIINSVRASVANELPCLDRDSGPPGADCVFPPATDTVTLRATGERSDSPPSFYTLRTALFHLDPSDRVVARVHLKQLARAALEFPESAGWIKMHAQQWWCGLFHGQRDGPPEACYSGRDTEFEAEWESLLRDDPTTFDKTMWTLYRDASDAGWPGLTTDSLHTKQESVDAWQELRDLNMNMIDLLVEEVAAGDANAPFIQDHLEALAYLNDDDWYAYGHIKETLQRSNPQVSLTAIDAAVARYPYEALLPPLRVGRRTSNELMAKVGATGLPTTRSAAQSDQQSQHRVVVDLQLQRVKHGDLAGLDSEEFLVAICNIFFDDHHLFRRLGREFLAANPNVPWTDIESYVSGYEASLQVDDLRENASEHKAEL